MRVGIKMSSGWNAETAWSVIASDFPGFLSQLQAIGIKNIEFSLWNKSSLNELGPAFEIEQIEAYAEMVIGAGLQISLHPYSHIDHRGPSHFAPETQGQVIAHMESVIDYGHRLAIRQKTQAHIIFHAAECLGIWEDDSMSHELVRPLLLSRSRNYFKKANDYAQKIRANVRLFCEIVPTPSRGMRIGDRPSEVYTMIQGTGIDICWDTGHYDISSRSLGFPLFPEHQFLKSVGHVHLHGVSNGRDHQPATQDDAYLHRCLELLRSVSFDGPVTLEYPYARNGRNDSQQIISSIKQGYDIVQQSEQPPPAYPEGRADAPSGSAEA